MDGDEQRAGSESREPALGPAQRSSKRLDPPLACLEERDVAICGACQSLALRGLGRPENARGRSRRPVDRASKGSGAGDGGGPRTTDACRNRDRDSTTGATAGAARSRTCAKARTWSALAAALDGRARALARQRTGG